MARSNRGPEVAGVAGFFLALTTIAIALRCYCRAFVVKSFGWDDNVAIIAYVLFVIFAGFAITGVQYGTGQHASAIPPGDIPIGLKWWWACEPVYVLSNMALKLSIGIMLYRIAVSRVHKAIIWTVMIVHTLYGAFFFFLFVLQCQPSAYFWTQYTGGKGKCINPNITVAATYGYSAISCWTDWTMAILPVFLIWNLQMNIRTKISVAMILSMGAIASTATIVRIPYVKGLANQADFLYATTDVAIWSTVETGIGIAASSFATLRPLFRTFFLRSRLMGGSSTQGPSGPWPASGPHKYVRSQSRGGGEEFGLRSDIGKNHGVTTTIESHNAAEGEKSGVSRQDSSRALNKHTRWGNSETVLRLGDSGSEDGLDWESGIRKTTVSTQVAHV
ncbi:hypothetical protein DL95DRAFT_394894 [Leptodontidium sp. 2 PMI_412]|nr:hypothetical protein BKA61DRAFT_546581 [Leptodontidium sp. MPI-SDFR-AT-0119]KAH9208811.1 hypothetical protein DL95DRAFT_394894 [Leptodontidium sp. 2 PMI_412]